MLYSASYDYRSNVLAGQNCIYDGSGVPWIMSGMNSCQLGGFSMKEFVEALTNVFLNLDILGFSYIFTRPLTFSKPIIFSEAIFCFIIGCVESVSDLGYCENIKPMTCVVHATVVVSSLWSKLLAMNWRKHSIDSSSNSTLMNSIVNTLAYFSKSNIVEYDNKISQCIQNINQNTWSCDYLMNKQTNSK